MYGFTINLSAAASGWRERPKTGLIWRATSSFPCCRAWPFCSPLGKSAAAQDILRVHSRPHQLKTSRKNTWDIGYVLSPDTSTQPSFPQGLDLDKMQGTVHRERNRQSLSSMRTHLYHAPDNLSIASHDPFGRFVFLAMGHEGAPDISSNNIPDFRLSYPISHCHLTVSQEGC